MDPYEPHSFIVKIWIEESLEEADEATWRGHITHVPSEERRYLQNLDDIIDFVAPYLHRLGVSTRRMRRRGVFRTPRRQTQSAKRALAKPKASIETGDDDG
jgi:hypothetical protein